jgi:hypothetical protein
VGRDAVEKYQYSKVGAIGEARVGCRSYVRRTGTV